MAVKKHELVHDDHNQLDLNSLMQYIKLMNEQPHYMPPPSELVKNCQDIVKCLSRIPSTDDRLWELLQSIEEFLHRAINSVHSGLRHELITTILDKFHAFTFDPQSDECPATSIILVVLDGCNDEDTLSTARWLVQQGSKEPGDSGLRASLSCLYRWVYKWQGTPTLGHWVMAYIKALEENENFDLLVEVSVDNVCHLFLAMDNPVALRQSVAEVIFHVMASLRESAEALDRISPHVGRVLVNLAADSGQWSRQILQDTVDILTAMIDGRMEALKGEAQDEFKEKYADLISCLERYMASRDCRFLQRPPWRARVVSLPGIHAHVPMRKVGLLNLGNTCYMNSVMQALLVTRPFSTHAVLKMNAVPYWSRMGILFAKMTHSISTKLNPDEFFSVVKPPFFTKDNQHDSSEFLGYLFELLQSHEHGSDCNFDYTRPPIIVGRRAIGHGSGHSPQHSSDGEHSEPGPKSRSASPRPESSAAGSSSGLKRHGEHETHLPLKKRLRMSDAYLRRDSFIDSMFGGVLLTRVECTVCQSASLSRDVFRDLQLAFPEKLEGAQHSVQSLLEFYCTKERLSGDNRYECRDCGVLRDAERSVLIEATPKFLILVLKNFKFEPKLQVQTKLMLSIHHNHTVTLPTVRSQADHSTYILYAAVIHAGTTLDSGHYYTLAKDNGQWHMYNDDVVSPAEEGQLSGLNRSSTPYILFYRRTDVDEGAVPSLEDMPPRVQEAVLAHNKHYVDSVRKMRLTRP